MIEPAPVVRHRIAIRSGQVVAKKMLTPSFVRITVAGAELDDFVSSGAADHCKLFFADPTTGTVHVPTITDGSITRPESGPVVARDYTPRAYRPATADGPAQLDLDFFLHADGGPASTWARTCATGDRLSIAGPRGSRALPSGVRRLVLAGDETALPALARWIEDVPDDIEIVAFGQISTDSDAAYLEPAHVHRAKVIWLPHDPERLDRAIRDLGQLDAHTLVWASGEASGLIPIRRYLRRELGLPAAQVQLSGYWKRGEIGHDHHAPIDPADTDD